MCDGQNGSSAMPSIQGFVPCHQLKEVKATVDVKTFTAYVEWDPETKSYVGIVPGIAGAHTQGATLDELQKNLKEVLELCLEELGGSLEDLPHFVGLQQVEPDLSQRETRRLDAGNHAVLPLLSVQ